MFRERDKTIAFIHDLSNVFIYKIFTTYSEWIVTLPQKGSCLTPWPSPLWLPLDVSANTYLLGYSLRKKQIFIAGRSLSQFWFCLLLEVE